MSKKIRMIGAEGIGDFLIAAQCAHYIKLYKDAELDLAVCARDEVFAPIKQLFGDKFNLTQLPEEYAKDDLLEKDDKIWNEVSKGFDECYYNKPDTLFLNKHSFPYKEYNLSLSTLIKTKTLTNKSFLPILSDKPIIFINCCSSTEGYLYPYIPELVNFLAENNPNYDIYVINNITWENKKIGWDIVPKYSNILIINNPKFEDSIRLMAASSFGIFTDNGPSHIYYHMSSDKNRLLLDPQFDKLPFIARWREDYNDSIPINTSPMDICRLVTTLIKEHPTQLLPRKMVLDKIWLNDTNWKNNLIYKFS